MAALQPTPPFPRRRRIRLAGATTKDAYLVDAIDLLEPGDTTKETRNRFRIEFNVSFSIQNG